MNKKKPIWCQFITCPLIYKLLVSRSTYTNAPVVIHHIESPSISPFISFHFSAPPLLCCIRSLSLFFFTLKIFFFIFSSRYLYCRVLLLQLCCASRWRRKTAPINQSLRLLALLLLLLLLHCRFIQSRWNWSAQQVRAAGSRYHQLSATTVYWCWCFLSSNSLSSICSSGSNNRPQVGTKPPEYPYK